MCVGRSPYRAHAFTYVLHCLCLQESYNGRMRTPDSGIATKIWRRLSTRLVYAWLLGGILVPGLCAETRVGTERASIVVAEETEAHRSIRVVLRVYAPKAKDPSAYDVLHVDTIGGKLNLPKEQIPQHARLALVGWGSSRSGPEASPRECDCCWPRKSRLVHTWSEPGGRCSHDWHHRRTGSPSACRGITADDPLSSQ